MVSGSLSTAYQGRSSEPAIFLQTICGVTGYAGSPISQTHRYHVESLELNCQDCGIQKAGGCHTVQAGIYYRGAEAFLLLPPESEKCYW